MPKVGDIISLKENLVKGFEYFPSTIGTSSKVFVTKISSNDVLFVKDIKTKDFAVIFYLLDSKSNIFHVDEVSIERYFYHVNCDEF